MKRTKKQDWGEERLHERVAKFVDAMDGRNRIAPAWVAQAVVDDLLPTEYAIGIARLLKDGGLKDGAQRYETLRYGCNLQCRQIARAHLARKWGTDTQAAAEEEQATQHPLFPNLQRYYPMAHTSTREPTYVRLEEMSLDDVRYNVQRMRRIGHGQLRSADALEAWWETQTVAA